MRVTLAGMNYLTRIAGGISQSIARKHVAAPMGRRATRNVQKDFFLRIVETIRRGYC